jgi:hypothetical protein
VQGRRLVVEARKGIDSKWHPSAWRSQFVLVIRPPMSVLHPHARCGVRRHDITGSEGTVTPTRRPTHLPWGPLMLDRSLPNISATTASTATSYLVNRAGPWSAHLCRRSPLPGSGWPSVVQLQGPSSDQRSISTQVDVCQVAVGPEVLFDSIMISSPSGWVKNLSMMVPAAAKSSAS